MPNEPSEEVPSAARGRNWPAVLLLAGAVAVCYANSLAVPFLFDDPRPETRLDYSTRPLVSASFALNRALSGEHVWSYHALNVLVHLACGLLLLGILRRTLARAAPELAEVTRSGLALVTTLAWLCHPLQTGAVTYLSQRAESMGAFFLLGCLYAFIRSTTTEPPLVWQVLSLAALVAGFATKETIVVAPLLVLLYDATFVEQGRKRAVETRKGFYKALGVVAALSCLLFIVPLLVSERGAAGVGLGEHGPLAHARSQPGVVLHYLRLALWPHPLVFDHGWPVAKDLSEYLPQTLFLAALLGAAVVLLLRRSWIGFAASWFFVCLAPTSSVVPIQDLASEYRVYLPLAGVLFLLVAGGAWFCRRILPRTRFLPEGLSVALLLALTATTVLRNRDYRSPAELWQTVVARAPRNPRGHAGLASELIGAGKLDQASAALRTAIELEPRYHSALHLLGGVHRLRSEWGPAIEAYRQASAAADLPAYRYGLACALLGKGAFSEAETSFRRALELEPAKAENHLGLGKALGQLERVDEAMAEYREALRLDEGLQDAHINLAVLLQSMGKPSEALEHHKKALAIPPNTIEEEFNLGQCLVSLGRIEEALDRLRAASKLAPAMPEPQAAIARALLSKENASPEEKAEALRLAGKANETTGSKRADILETLAKAHAANRDPAAAAALVEKALELPGPTRNAAFRERLLAQLQQYRLETGQ